MASIKIFSLAVKTLAKPIANQLKQQATEHESFRNFCIGLAQTVHRTEARMRMGLLNEEAKNIKPLNDAKAVQNGSNTLAEAFLFLVGAGLVLGETYRTSRKNEKRRDEVADRLESLEEEIQQLRGVESHQVKELQERSDGLERALSTVVANGLRAGWLSLGHSDSEVLNLLGQLPGQPLALRAADGSDNGASGSDDEEGGMRLRDAAEAVMEQQRRQRAAAMPLDLLSDVAVRDHDEAASSASSGGADAS